MDSTGKALLKLLFNPGEHICVSDTQYANKSLPLEQVLEQEKIILKSNNPDVKDNEVLTSNLILVAMNPMKPNSGRLDSNVSDFRTFLIELDMGSIKSQLNTIKHIKIPISAQIFSGNKSVHNCITLEDSLPDEKSYRHIVEWIYNIITLADDNCGNVSRCVRIPGAYREDNKKQRLISLNRRITQKELIGWLNEYEHLRPKAKERKQVLTIGPSLDKLSPWVSYSLAKGIDFSVGRNKRWFSIAVDFAKAGYSEEQAIEYLQSHFQEESDFKEKEWLKSISQGFKYVQEGN